LLLHNADGVDNNDNGDGGSGDDLRQRPWAMLLGAAAQHMHP
jgi:hypothetical protein